MSLRFQLQLNIRDPGEIASDGEAGEEAEGTGDKRVEGWVG